MAKGRGMLGMMVAATMLLVGCQQPGAISESGGSGSGGMPGTATAASVSPLPTATPEEVGTSSTCLTRLHDGMQALVDDGRLAGITTMIAREDRVVDFRTHGFRDLEAEDPMEEDAILRVYSMSKPITGVALMTL